MDDAGELAATLVGYLGETTFDDVRRAAERAEGGRGPAPLPRFSEVLEACCRRLAPRNPPPDVARWLLDRAPAALELEEVMTFVHVPDLTEYERLDLAWRLPPADRAFALDGAMRLAWHAALGPVSSVANRRALCRQGSLRSRAPGSLTATLAGACSNIHKSNVCGALGSRAAFAGCDPYELLEDFELDLRIDIGLADHESYLVTSRGARRVAASAREFVRRRLRRARENAAAFARWRAAASAACAALGRRGDAALALVDESYRE